MLPKPLAALANSGKVTQFRRPFRVTAKVTPRAHFPSRAKAARARAMLYVSTRGSAPALDFEGVTLAGLASDGGLYVPAEWPGFTPDEIAAMTGPRQEPANTRHRIAPTPTQKAVAAAYAVMTARAMRPPIGPV